MESTAAAYASLLERPLPRPGVFEAIEYPGHPGAWLAKDSDSRPAVLLELQDFGDSPPPLETRYLRVLFGAPCIVAARGVERQAPFVLLHCLSAEDGLVKAFFRAVSLVVPTSGFDDAARLRTAVAQLVELFRALERPSRKSLQGLWGELLVIALAHDPRKLLNAWHGSPTDRFDFARGAERIEVKTAVLGSRQHHFRLEQLHSDLLTVSVVSLTVEATGGGQTIGDLADEIRLRIAGNVEGLLKLERVIAQTLGQDWHLATIVRFDRHTAEDTFWVVDARTVPKVPEECVPDGVSEVGFIADLRLCPKPSHSDLAKDSFMYSLALLDRRP